jgi:antirestriction protein ArdC
MNDNFKPLDERTAEKMAADLKRGVSVFQQPNNSPNSALPFNIETGARYNGPSALILLMQKRDDPRWGTSNQANRNHTAVMKGATSTVINFLSSYEFQKVFDEAGQPVLKENGKQRTERVKLDQPKLVTAWLFNAEQMRKMPKWEKEPQELAPAERAQLILDNSGARIENGGEDMFYEPESDTIYLPEKEQFASPEQYFSEGLHQLTHRTAVLEPDQTQEYARDQSDRKFELRANLASLFLSKELNLPYELNYHVGYVNTWAHLLKEEPGELFKAAVDAQKLVDKVLGFENQVEQKADITNEHEQGHADEQQDFVEETTAKSDLNKLNKGEVIPYNGTTYKVVSELKNKVYQMQDLSDNRKFKMSLKDELFKSLVSARNNSLETVIDNVIGMNRGDDYDDNLNEGMEEDFEAEHNQMYSR